jgi:hypothetical protein
MGFIGVLVVVAIVELSNVRVIFVVYVFVVAFSSVIHTNAAD